VDSTDPPFAPTSRAPLHISDHFGRTWPDRGLVRHVAGHQCGHTGNHPAALTRRKSEGSTTTRSTTDDIGAPRGRHREENIPGTETRAAFETTELIVYVLAVLGVLIASAIVDTGFGADPAWR
jgi:hypothetical protein